jgi:hypothetical protein
MPLRVQADADLNQNIVSAVVRRVPAIDFKTATAAALAGVDDPDVIARAVRESNRLPADLTIP